MSAKDISLFERMSCMYVKEQLQSFISGVQRCNYKLLFRLTTVTSQFDISHTAGSRNTPNLVVTTILHHSTVCVNSSVAWFGRQFLWRFPRPGGPYYSTDVHLDKKKLARRTYTKRSSKPCDRAIDTLCRYDALPHLQL